jgi:hypothetical protein
VNGGGYSERAATWQSKDFFRVGPIMIVLQSWCTATSTSKACTMRAAEVSSRQEGYTIGAKNKFAYTSYTGASKLRNCPRL